MIGLTFRQLEYFEALARTLHFGRAAAMVGVSQPALSSQIATMEERLGCRLFDRDARSVRMTSEAIEMAPQIEALLVGARRVEASFRRERRAMEGRFRLGIIPTMAPYLLPRLMPALRRKFPSSGLELREAVTDVLAEDTAAGRLDGFVAALPLDYPQLVAEELFADRFFLAVPADDPTIVAPPIPPESPLLERLMLLEDGHCLREQALAVCGRVRPVAMANFGATSLTTLLQMVGHGLGVTLLPEMAVGSTDALAEIRIVPFAAPEPERKACMAWRQGSSREADARVLGQLIRQVHAPSGATS